MKSWPRTDEERTAEVLERLAARLRDDGPRFRKLAHDFLATGFPSGAGEGKSGGSQSIVEAQAIAGSPKKAGLPWRRDQLTEDCSDLDAALKELFGVAANFHQRMGRVLATDESQRGRVSTVEACRECGEPIVGKVKRLDGWPYHLEADDRRPACYWVAYRKGRRGA